MGFYFTDVLFVLSLILLIWRAKPVASFSEINKGSFNTVNCDALRGFFSLIVLFVHIANYTSYSKFGGWFTTNGNATVGAFFFFTGFGLMKQYITKDNYDKGYLLKRLPKVLFPYIAATVVYWAADFVFLGFLYPVSGILHAIACGVPIVIYSWYVIHVLLFYVVFYVLMKLCGKHYNLMVLGGVLYYALTTAIFIWRDFGIHWYQTSLVLPIGMLFAIYEDAILKAMSKWYYIALSLLLAITVFVYYCGAWPVNKVIPESFAIDKVCVSVLMVMVVIFSMMKVTYGNAALSFVSKYSFEIYLLQGFVMMSLKNDRFNIENEILFGSLAVLLTIACAMLFKYAMNIVFKLWNILIKKVSQKG